MINSSPLPGSLSVSLRIYRLLLAAYPGKFREDYEAQMVQVFRDLLRDEYRRHGLPGLIDLWLHTCADLLVSALIERISERSRYMFSPKVVLLGGVAAICAGLFWLVAGSPDSGALPLVLGFLLGLGGLAGLYSRQARQGGRLGLAGLVVGLIGTGLPLATLWWALDHVRTNADLVAAPRVILMLPLGMLILGAAVMLLGISSLREKTPHRWPGLPLALALLYTLAGASFWLAYYLPLSRGQNPWNPWNYQVYVLNPIVMAALGVGWILVGISLATEVYGRVVQPPASAQT